ncbi:DUF779 domain-containing protein [Nocardia salmonicida]|uniref:DUF779 domain-containing protein n=1 Tax=Nocardia salmonicida TaxID=53431 RepID=UPI0007A4ABEB|nr:DUF779 domain-containing protein [Nocardia salmonicida]
MVRHPNGRKVDHRHRAVEASEDALRVLRLLLEMHGPVVLYLAPDTDGYTPICVRRSEFRPGAGDVLAGQTAWHTQLWMAERFHVGFDDIDVRIEVRNRPQRGSASLEATCGFRFALRVDNIDAAAEFAEEAS